MLNLLKLLISNWVKNTNKDADGSCDVTQLPTTILIDLHHVVDSIANPLVKNHLLEQLPQFCDFLAKKYSSPCPVNVRAYGCLNKIGLVQCEYKTEYASVRLVDTPVVNGFKHLAESELLLDLLVSESTSNKIVIISQNIAFKPALFSSKSSIEVIGFRPDNPWSEIEILNGFDLLADSKVLSLELAYSVLANELSSVSSMKLNQLSYELSDFRGNDWMGLSSCENFIQSNFQVHINRDFISRTVPVELIDHAFISELFYELKKKSRVDAKYITDVLKCYLIKKHGYIYSERELFEIAIKILPQIKKNTTNCIACDYIRWVITGPNKNNKTPHLCF